MGNPDQILAELNPLIAEAERTRKWLHCSYQDIWFSPAELREANADGRFIWGACNWTLRAPIEQATRLAENIANAEQALAAFVKRMA